MKSFRVCVGVFAVAATALTVSAGSATAEPASCAWAAVALPLPADTQRGQVTTGDGDWFAGVAGPELFGDPEQGVLWHDGHLIAPGAAFGLRTYLHSVNPGGVAVGNVVGADGYNHAIRYRDGAYEYLPEPAGSSNALDINPRGDITGYDGATTLVVWQADGSTRTLPVPAGETPYGWPAIDDDGTVVAWTGFFDANWTFRSRGYVWAPDGTRTMLTPPAAEAGIDVRDVKNGRVVGSSGSSNGASVAAAWTVDGQVAGTYPNGSLADAVNRTGDVVGAGPGGLVMLWPSDGDPVSLPMLAGHGPGVATAVNDHEVGGTLFPDNGSGSTPVRWVCG
jgi:hypothetical protein